MITLVSHFLSLLEDCDKRRVLFYRHEDEKSILFFILDGEWPNTEGGLLVLGHFLKKTKT